MEWYLLGRCQHSVRKNSVEISKTHEVVHITIQVGIHNVVHIASAIGKRSVMLMHLYFHVAQKIVAVPAP